MSIHLEQIDELRKRSNVSYEEAKDALEKFDGNMVDAMIFLEKNKRIRSFGQHHYHHEHIHRHHHGEFSNKVKELWKRGNRIRFIVTRKDKTLLNVPLSVSLLIAVFTLKYSIAALVIALIFGCRFKFYDGTEGMKVNETLDKMHDNIDNFKSKLTQEA